MKQVRIIACVAACVALAGCGGGSRSDEDRMFLTAAASWDANRDNVVTCEEWKAYAGELFDAADRGRTGALGPDEFKTLENTDRMFSVVDFKYYDASRNGRVERAELVDRPNPAFTIADANKDCKLSTLELTAARDLGAPKKPVDNVPMSKPEL
ncbi:MAG: hypothetical protein NW215_08470 [Hyphomicrobiales bacterium]|nr:hypothetical protein [Hyphomicrobiales bacterium]